VFRIYCFTNHQGLPKMKKSSAVCFTVLFLSLSYFVNAKKGTSNGEAKKITQILKQVKDIKGMFSVNPRFCLACVAGICVLPPGAPCSSRSSSKSLEKAKGGCFLCLGGLCVFPPGLTCQDSNTVALPSLGDEDCDVCVHGYCIAPPTGQPCDNDNSSAVISNPYGELSKTLFMIMKWKMSNMFR